MKRRDLMAWAAIGGAGLVAGPARAQSLTWEEVAGPNGRYRLEMPKGYRHRTVPQAGRGTRQSYLIELGGNFAMELMIYDYEQNDQDRPPDDLYSQLLAAESLVKRRWPGARVLEQKDLQLGPAQGRGFVLAIDGGQKVLAARIYYLNARLYEQVAIVPAADRNSPVLARFMNSLSISS